MKHRPLTRRKKTSPKKNILLILSACIVGLLALYGGFKLIKNVVGMFTHSAEAPMVKSVYLTPPVKFNGKYKTIFDDIQEVQIEAAVALGIDPVANAEEIIPLLEKGDLVVVGDETNYDCQADYPYLVPVAAELLDEVRKRYQQAEGEPKQLRLTSCMRTISSVKGLKRWNPNSVENSCHLYGTTFDISYSRMTPEERRRLGQVLYELQQGGYCYVKYERKQPCFHITVRRGADIVEVD